MDNSSKDPLIHGIRSQCMQDHKSQAYQGAPSPPLHSWKKPGHSRLHIIVRNPQGSPSSDENPHRWELSRHKARVLWSCKELQFKIRDKVFPIVDRQIKQMQDFWKDLAAVTWQGEVWKIPNLTAVTQEGRSKAETCFPTSSHCFGWDVSFSWGAYLAGVYTGSSRGDTHGPPFATALICKLVFSEVEEAEGKLTDFHWPAFGFVSDPWKEKFCPSHDSLVNPIKALPVDPMLFFLTDTDCCFFSVPWFIFSHVTWKDDQSSMISTVFFQMLSPVTSLGPLSSQNKR